MNYWLLVWSILCMLSSICTTSTFLIEPSRFKYPEKPIIYLSICYLFVSLGYLMKFVFGHEKMACETDGSIRSVPSIVHYKYCSKSVEKCEQTFIFRF